MPEFIHGLELSEHYFNEAVKPILQEHWPELVYSAGLLGPGSEVLGFDTEMSRDHNWGPKVVLYLSDEDSARLAQQIRRTLSYRLPLSFRGYPSHFEEVADEAGTVVPRQASRWPINHGVQVTVLHRFLQRYLGMKLEEPLSIADWLTMPEQKLRTLTAGAVFHDALDVLEPIRRKLSYYPRDVWLYLMSAQWQRIGQEEPFVGRAGIVGDNIGSAIIAARLVRDLVRLCFMMERQYAPYAKWLGSAFEQLGCAAELAPLLEQVLGAARWRERERHLCTAYECVAAMHNDLGITEPLRTTTSQFHNRPFMVIQGEAIARLIWDAIQDPGVRALPFGVGKIDQYVDSTDVLAHASRCQRLGAMYTKESR
jgi:hypothetical protein